MTKTWGTIRGEVLNLGFEPSANYEKQKEAFARAYNWAQNHIAATVGCLVDEITIEKNKSATVQIYDLPALTEQKLGCDFLALSQTGIVNAATLETVDCAKMTDNRFLTLPADFQGEIKIFFAKSPQPIYTQSPDDTLCQLPYKWAMVLPYYMASRLYMDDDGARSSYYWNLAEDMKEEILAAENQPQLTVINENGWCG